MKTSFRSRSFSRNVRPIEVLNQLQIEIPSNTLASGCPSRAIQMHMACQKLETARMLQTVVRKNDRALTTDAIAFVSAGFCLSFGGVSLECRHVRDLVVFDMAQLRPREPKARDDKRLRRTYTRSLVHPTLEDNLAAFRNSRRRARG